MPIGSPRSPGMRSPSTGGVRSPSAGGRLAARRGRELAAEQDPLRWGTPRAKSSTKKKTKRVASPGRNSFNESVSHSNDSPLYHEDPVVQDLRQSQERDDVARQIEDSSLQREKGLRDIISDERTAASQREKELQAQIFDEREEARRLRLEWIEGEAVQKHAEQEREAQLKSEIAEARAEVHELRRKVTEAEEKDKNWEALTERLKEEYYTAMQQWGDMETSVQKTQEELGRKRRAEQKALEASLDEERELRAEAERKLAEREALVAEITKANTELGADLRSTSAKLADSQEEAGRLRDEVTMLGSVVASKDRDMETLKSVEERRREVLVADFQAKENTLLKLVEESKAREQYQLKRFKELKDRYLSKKKAHEDCKVLVAEGAKELLDMKIQQGQLESDNTQQANVITQLEAQVKEYVQLQVEAAERMSDQARYAWQGSVEPYMLGGGASVATGSPGRGRLHGPAKLRWSSNSPTRARHAIPFSSTVRSATPPLPILDNGPTRYSPISRDAPVVSGTFRYTAPPQLRQYFVGKDGQRVLAPASQWAVPTQKSRYEVSRPPSPDAPPRSTPVARRRSASMGSHSAMVATPARSAASSASPGRKRHGSEVSAAAPSSVAPHPGSPAGLVVSQTSTNPCATTPPTHGKDASREDSPNSQRAAELHRSVSERTDVKAHHRSSKHRRASVDASTVDARGMRSPSTPGTPSRKSHYTTVMSSSSSCMTGGTISLESESASSSGNESDDESSSSSGGHSDTTSLTFRPETDGPTRDATRDDTHASISLDSDPSYVDC
eukprot:Rhum_TRINITY_DN17389_c0_g1::Rhum_TRINITY_DN17389_c0_g1_i1::g.165895::m.165895